MTLAVVMPLAEQRGGAEIMLRHLLQSNAATPQLDLALAFLEDGPMAAEALSLGYAVEVFPAGRLRHAGRYARTVRDLVRWLRARRPDAVLSWMAKAHLYAGPAAAWAGMPAFWFQHGITSGSGMDRLVTHLPAHAVLCCSRAAAQAQQRLRPARPTVVVHPAVDLARFNPDALPTPAEARTHLGLPRGGPLIGMVARLQRGKGVYIFVDAAMRILQARPEATFVIVGGAHAMEPGCPAALKGQVERLGLGQRIRLVGYQADVWLWVQALDVLVVPSVEPEGFGMVILEGLALGKPVVATATGGTAEALTGPEGRLVAPGDGEELATAVLAVLDGDPSSDEQVALARCSAERFSAERLSERLARVLAERIP